MNRTRVLALAAAALLVAAGWLFTYDVHVPITGYGPPDDSFCGSAYDVVLLKKDGYMGGEIPPNQDRIDAACMSRARKYVAASAATGGLGVVLLVQLGMTLRRRRRDEPQLEGAPAALG